MTDSEMAERVAWAIDEEPELPGEMPDAMRIVLEQAIDTRDMDLLIELLRITIRQTKRGIKERVSAIPRPVPVGGGDGGGEGMKYRKVRIGKKGWSYWQKPKMKGYLMQCCDCGLVHEVEFRVYRILERHPDGAKTVELAGDEYEVGIRMRRFCGGVK